MKISYSWLKEFVSFTETPEEVAKILTRAGLEVEAIESISPPSKGIVLVEIREINPHPNADRLKVTQVFDGKETLQVVTAAPNPRVGMKTALAKIGATLRDEQGKSLEIKKASLRGVDSFGMFLGAQDLGFDEKSDHIIEIEDDLPLGLDLAAYLSDTVLEISLTPNLGHCMSVRGVARELAAQLGKKTTFPSYVLPKKLPKADFFIENKAQKEVPLYSAILIEKVTTKKTPLWMRKRLLASGLRSIDLLVDIGNYVMLEMGQPLHFFDKALLKNNALFVNTLKQPLETLLLNDKKVMLASDTITIEDQEGVLAAAGIMGAERGKVTEGTTSLVIESAVFDAARIRKTAKAIGIRSDAAMRFEKGVDQLGAESALARAALLVAELTGGTLFAPIVLKSTPYTPKKVALSCKRVNALLGTGLSVSEIIEMLSLLDITVLSQEEDQLLFQIPSYRNDITAPIDLVEEVVRMYGFNNLTSCPNYRESVVSDTPLFTFENAIRRHLIAQGLQEFITCDLISPALVKLTEEITLPQACEIAVMHPSSIDQSVLRTSLLPGLLTSVFHNHNQKRFDISAFEVGKVHYQMEGKFHEHLAAGLVLTGSQEPYHFTTKSQEVDFFDIKGLIENLFSSLHIQGYELEISHLKTLHPTRQARIKKEGSVLGCIGEVHPEKLQQVGIEKRVYYAELHLHELLKNVPSFLQVSPLPQYPGSNRDWTVWIEEKVRLNDLLNHIHALNSSLLRKIELLDIYRKDSMSENKKSITLRLHYQSLERTLSHEEIEKEHERLTQEVAKKFAIPL